ncbi:hypothetical protein [Piscinibacter koreensis]|uniref:Uncharacterized protein n=1 Tax=Piscinibacter koreensis TaxID=2742824 RepID=A0A7Y6NPE4_9BURK|nr:hypothetical protein [Schlegelella koreensis]NUZ06764.1 hypothetical protein [Schlegelella koreensis]
MDSNASPTCPDCGFRIFNRRYPKCESCGALLPDSIVYTSAERSAIFEAERLGREAREREARARESDTVSGVPDELAATETIIRLS